MGLDCTVDPSYRRANRHDKVRELQQQLEELQNSVECQQYDTPQALALSVPQKSQQTQQPLEHEPGGQAVIAPVVHVSAVATLATENPTIDPITQARQPPSLGCGPITPGNPGDHHALSPTTAAETPDGGSSITTNPSAVFILETTRLTQEQVKAMFATWVRPWPSELGYVGDSDIEADVLMLIGTSKTITHSCRSSTRNERMKHATERRRFCSGRLLLLQHGSSNLKTAS
jgi:hypothetical protein